MKSKQFLYSFSLYAHFLYLVFYTRSYLSQNIARVRKPQNIISRLRNRELTDISRFKSHYYIHRQLYQNIFPNLSVINIEKPPCFLRKFTPDGRYLIAFSNDQTSLEIYEYNGPAAAENLLQSLNITEEYTNDASSKLHQLITIKSKIFDLFFKFKHIVNITNNNEQLNRECSLFTDDSQYVIVGSAAYIQEDYFPNFYDVYRNNESIQLNSRATLEDYSINLIDIHNGRVCDRITFKTDRIFLSHNQGIYLYKNVLSILSVQHQTIHIYHLVTDGLNNTHFINVKNIGRFCYEDDEFLISSVTAFQRGPPVRPFRENCINSLKHRLIVYLHRKAEADSITTGSYYPLRQFYQNFNQYLALRMWKMQLLDENYLLIKYANEEVVSSRLSDLNSPPSFFAIYNINTTMVIAVYENTSDELLWLFENFCDHFRNAVNNYSKHICSPSNNVQAHLIQQRFKQTIINARNGGPTEATRRLLSQLPISAQSYSSSPYLDLSLFSYDDKWVSVMERPKACGDHPIRFYARDSGFLRFKIYAGLQGRSMPISTRKLVAFTFHPFDPFALSVQRTNSDYVVNLHIRHRQLD